MLVNIVVRPVYSGRGTIIMLHRVLPRHKLSKIALNQNIELTTDDLESLIVWATSTNYKIVSLEKFCANVKARRGRRMLCLTFDDGYVDNLTYALPILEKYAVPATIFVTTDMPDLRLRLWWYALETGLQEDPNRDTKFLAIHDSIIKNSSLENDNLFSDLGFTEDAFRTLCAKLALTWDDIRTLARHPLITIGAHTISHPVLSSLSEYQQDSEIRGSKRRLEREIQKEVKFFAYPFGIAGHKEFDAVKRAGFEAAVTDRFGNVVDGHRDHLCALPRHWAGNPNFSISSLDSRISGYAYLRSGVFYNPMITE